MLESKTESSVTLKKQVSKSHLTENFHSLDDLTLRGKADLRVAQSFRGELPNGDLYFQIELNDKETIQVKFKDTSEWEKWGVVIVDSKKTDDELR